VLGGGNLLQMPARFYQRRRLQSACRSSTAAACAPTCRQGRAVRLAVAQYNQTLVGAVNEVSDDYDAA
jgi:hypothetical protein